MEYHNEKGLKRKERVLDRLIETSLAMVRAQFSSYGFSQEQIAPLLEAGERDLGRELERVKAIMSTEPPEREALDQALHAVKGLLLNMGNKEAAETFTELRHSLDSEQSLKEIRRLLEPEV